jgi:O-succinylbenzoate synthase
MKITAFDIYPYALGLRRPLTVRGHELQSREGLILRIKSEDGREGFGDIAPLPGASRETLAQALGQIQHARACLLDQPVPRHVEALDGRLERWLKDFKFTPSVQFGVESAVLHLSAYTEHARPVIHVTGLLQGGISEVAGEAAALLASGFTDFKLKVGGEVGENIEKVRRVNEVIYGRALLHLDANQAWSFEEALAFGQAVGCAAVNYIEEPFRDIRRVPEFYEETMIPVALDESVARCSFEDIRSISGVETLVLKPTLLGGLEKTRRLMRQAEQMAMSTVVSSSFESSLGVWMLAHLAAVSNHHVVAGLDTLKWFTDDVLKEPLTARRGALSIDGRSIASDDIHFGLLKKLT